MGRLSTLLNKNFFVKWPFYWRAGIMWLFSKSTYLSLAKCPYMNNGSMSLFWTTLLQIFNFCGFWVCASLSQWEFSFDHRRTLHYLQNVRRRWTWHRISFKIQIITNVTHFFMSSNTIMMYISWIFPLKNISNLWLISHESDNYLIKSTRLFLTILF